MNDDLYDIDSDTMAVIAHIVCARTIVIVSSLWSTSWLLCDHICISVLLLSNTNPSIPTTPHGWSCIESVTILFQHEYQHNSLDVKTVLVSTHLLTIHTSVLSLIKLSLAHNHFETQIIDVNQQNWV